MLIDDDFLREQAAKYRELAEGNRQRQDREEFLELAAVCDETANKLEDRQTGG
jgi:hypothetical protein